MHSRRMAMILSSEQQRKFGKLLLNLLVQLTPAKSINIDVINDIHAEIIKAATAALLDFEMFLEALFPYTKEAREEQLTRLDVVSKGIRKLLEENISLKDEITILLKSRDVNFSIIAALFEAKQITTQNAVENEDKSEFECAMHLSRALAIFVNLYSNKNVSAGNEQLVDNAMRIATENRDFYLWVDNVVCPAVRSIYQAHQEQVQEKKNDDKGNSKNVGNCTDSKKTKTTMATTKTQFHAQKTGVTITTDKKTKKWSSGLSATLSIKSSSNAFDRYSTYWFNASKEHPFITAFIIIMSLPSIVGVPILLAMFINGARIEKQNSHTEQNLFRTAKKPFVSSIQHIDDTLQKVGNEHKEQQNVHNAVISNDVTVNHEKNSPSNVNKHKTIAVKKVHLLQEAKENKNETANVSLVKLN